MEWMVIVAVSTQCYWNLRLGKSLRDQMVHINFKLLLKMQVGPGFEPTPRPFRITDFPAYSDTVYSDTPLTVTL